MKKKMMQLIGCFVTLVMTIGMIRYMGYRLDPPWSEEGFDAIDAYHSLEENTLDVIVYGSSHAWKGFDTRVLHDKYGIAAYNYGCNWQAINTTLLFLQDSLTTQSPKVICIDTFKVNRVEMDTDLDGEIYYCSEIPASEDKWKYLKTCFGKDPERYASYFFPLIMFHDNWNSISSENYSEPGYQRFVDTAGYYEQYDVYQCTIPDHTTFEQYELSDEAIDVLDEIVAECKERDIEIIFFTCPWEGANNYGDAMADYAKENGCAYLDLFENLDETGLDGATDLNDDGHLNASGAGKVADYMGKYIVSNYDLN